jgi:two-component system LytT family response regulator
MSHMLRALIVDDERLARQRLLEILAEIYPSEIQVVGQAENITRASELALSLRPEVIFLDVQMPPENGFALLPHLATLKPQPHVIFVTAFDTYAVRAFEANALDYLLKPVRPERLKTSIERLKSSFAPFQQASAGHASSENDSDTPAVVKATTYAPEDFIALKDGRSLMMIKTNEIRAIQAEGAYCHILITHNRKIMIKQSISNWQKSLPPEMFMRVSKSLLVNFLSITSINVETRERSQLILSGLDHPLIISRLENQRLRVKNRTRVRD